MSHPFYSCPNNEQCRALIEGQVKATMSRGHRTVRGLVHGAVAAGALAAVQAVHTALGSGDFDVKVAAFGAAQAALAAVIAYLHKAPTDSEKKSE